MYDTYSTLTAVYRMHNFIPDTGTFSLHRKRFGQYPGYKIRAKKQNASLLSLPSPFEGNQNTELCGCFRLSKEKSHQAQYETK